MKKIGLTTVLFIGIILGGVYYWNWQTLHRAAVISQPTGSQPTENDQSKQQPVNTPNDRINILVLGTDNRGDEVARSDSIMLISANVNTKAVSIISIPRDTRVDIPGVGLTKITHANAVGELNGGIHEGTLESAKAVSNLLGIPINYYVKIDFQGFKKAVDYVGGIDVNLPVAVNDDKRNLHLPVGAQHLSGEQALSLARTRYGLVNGDFDRQHDQFYLLSALAHQMLNLSNIPKLPEQLNVIHQDLMDTNLSTQGMASLGLVFKGIAKDSIKYYQLPGKGISAFDPLVGASVYYYEPDMAGVRGIVQEATAN